MCLKGLTLGNSYAIIVAESHRGELSLDSKSIAWWVVCSFRCDSDEWAVLRCRARCFVFCLSSISLDYCCEEILFLWTV